MVEDPAGATAVFKPAHEPLDEEDELRTDELLDDEEDHNAPLIDSRRPDTLHPISIDEERLDAPHRPITSRLRIAVSHLRNSAGLFGLFRGFHIALIYRLVYAVGSIPFQLLTRSPQLGGVNLVLRLILEGIFLTVLSPINLWWTLTVIAARSQQTRPRWQLLSHAISNTRKILLPTLYWAAAQTLTAAFPQVIIAYTSLGKYFLNPEFLPQVLSNPQELRAVSLLLLALSVTNLALYFGIGIPSNVMLYRVYASLHPGHLDTIVPLDPALSSRVVLAAQGETEQLTALDALRTFDRSSWSRLYKLYGTVLAIELALGILFGNLIGAEIVFAQKTML